MEASSAPSPLSDECHQEGMDFKTLGTLLAAAVAFLAVLLQVPQAVSTCMDIKDKKEERKWKKRERDRLVTEEDAALLSSSTDVESAEQLVHEAGPPGQHDSSPEDSGVLHATEEVADTFSHESKAAAIEVALDFGVAWGVTRTASSLLYLLPPEMAALIDSAFCVVLIVPVLLKVWRLRSLFFFTERVETATIKLALPRFVGAAFRRYSWAVCSGFAICLLATLATIYVWSHLPVHDRTPLWLFLLAWLASIGSLFGSGSGVAFLAELGLMLSGRVRRSQR